MDSWRDWCPVLGTCSECGLESPWVDVLRPERLAPQWSFEHAALRSIARALLLTLRRAISPRFWAQLPIASPIRMWRLLLLFCIVAVVLHAIAAGANLHANARILTATTWRVGVPTTSIRWPMVLMLAGQPYVQTDYMRQTLPAWAILLMLWGILTPLPYVLLFETMAQAKVRFAHLWRGVVYFAPMCVMILVVAIGCQHLGRWLAVSAEFDTISLLVATIAGGFVLWRWWCAFTRDYLRLRTPSRVTGVMLLIAFLASVCICLAISMDFMQDIGRGLI